MISGPQIDPYICETDLLGLQPSMPPKCESPTRYDYFYKPAGSSETDPFKTYDPNHPPSPSQIAVAITDEGVSTPFIVRRERGVINRAIYDIAVLQQPGQQRQPWDARGAWNGKLLMIFNGGTKNWHRQSLDGSIPDVLLVKDTSAHVQASEDRFSEGRFRAAPVKMAPKLQGGRTSPHQSLPQRHRSQLIAGVCKCSQCLQIQYLNRSIFGHHQPCVFEFADGPIRVLP
ncbi:hypothetical protein BLAT2472_130003 [Burkholderia latens]